MLAAALSASAFLPPLLFHTGSTPLPLPLLALARRASKSTINATHCIYCHSARTLLLVCNKCAASEMQQNYISECALELWNPEKLAKAGIAGGVAQKCSACLHAPHICSATCAILLCFQNPRPAHFCLGSSCTHTHTHTHCRICVFLYFLSCCAARTNFCPRCSCTHTLVQFANLPRD